MLDNWVTKPQRDWVNSYDVNNYVGQYDHDHTDDYGILT